MNAPNPATPPTNAPNSAATPTKAGLPGIRDIVRQTYFDLLQSKDIQDSPTFSYTWLADQFGHFSLGFLPVFLFSWIAAACGWKNPDLPKWLGWVVFSIWIVKEVRDFTLAYLHYKRSSGTFPFDSRELCWNVITAWLFFAMGTIVAVMSFYPPPDVFFALAVVALVAVLVSWWWLMRKMTFQQSDLPYLYRLAVFPDNIPEQPAIEDGLSQNDAKEFIAKMIDPESKDEKGCPWSGHLILSGDPNAGKSTLAVAIGTEYVFKLGICRYVTLVKLLQYSRSDRPTPTAERAIRGEEEFDDGRVIWRWDAANLLIVDDVDDIARVSHSDKINKDRYNSRVRGVLEGMIDDGFKTKMKAQPRTVWVCNDPIVPSALKGLLEQLLGYTNVAVLELKQAPKTTALE